MSQISRGNTDLDLDRRDRRDEINDEYIAIYAWAEGFLQPGIRPPESGDRADSLQIKWEKYDRAARDSGDRFTATLAKICIPERRQAASRFVQRQIGGSAQRAQANK
jgi:hypothetical protein